MSKKRIVIYSVLAFVVLVTLGTIAAGMTASKKLDTITQSAQPTNGVAGNFHVDMPKDNASASASPAPKTSFSDGVYEVNVDIKPGKYKTDGGPNCYYARLSSFNTTDIIANSASDGPAVVEIMPTDKAFQISSCTWTKQD